MDLDTAKRLLAEGGLRVIDERDLPYGTQIRLDNQAIVNVYHNGNYNVQGRNTEPVKQLLEGVTSAPNNTSTSGNKDIFVVYGHDERAKREIEVLLRRWDLNPLFLDQLPSEGQTIIEKLERYTQQVNYAVVLATPDDEGHRAGSPDEKAFRARQNVVLELGMMLATLGRQRVAILLKDPHEMEKPSDIEGLLYIPFTDDLERQAGITLAKELVEAGYDISITAL